MRPQREGGGARAELRVTALPRVQGLPLPQMSQLAGAFDPQPMCLRRHPRGRLWRGGGMSGGVGGRYRTLGGALPGPSPVGEWWGFAGL